MNMRKILDIAFMDLDSVVMTCAHCGTETSLPLKGKPHRPVTDGVFAPRHCTACGGDFDTATRALNSLHAAIQNLAELKGVSLRVEGQESHG